MRKLLPAVLLLSLFVVWLSGCGITQDDMDEEWEDGYAYGYESGYYDGFDEGYDEGYNEAELEYEDKYTEGYNSGNRDGYYAGATYTCLFFGDVDRALRSAYKGSAWGTFIDAYDQYISNIYDDDDTRSALFWAFVSVKSSNGMTAEERALLISTFGEDLFIRNGIKI